MADDSKGAEQDEITITVLGAPVPKGRPRFSLRGRCYTPPKTKAYEQKIQDCAYRALGWGTGAAIGPLDGPLKASVLVYLPIPKSWSKKKKLAAERCEVLPTGRPDIDNFIKAALDGLNGIAFKDDSQVVRLTAAKFYSARPKLTVTIERMVEV